MGPEVAGLPEREVAALRLAFEHGDAWTGRLVVLGVDDADGALVRVAGLPALRRPALCGLSADGTRMLFKEDAQEFDTALLRLCLVEPATGRVTRFGLADHVPRDSAVALAPDGTRVAVLSSGNEEYARVDLVDVASGRITRLWTCPDESWSGFECGVAWSPDGGRIAVTVMWFDHEETYDDWEGVVVLDAVSGAAGPRHDFMAVLGWLDAGSVVLDDPFSSGFAVLDAATGELRDVPGPPWGPGQSSGRWVGADGGRVIGCRGYNGPPGYAYFHADGDAADLRELFSLPGECGRFHLAAGTRPLDRFAPPGP